MLPVLLSIWIACLLFTAIMFLYRSRLTRDEEDQIFLDDSFAQERSAQAAIVDKVNKIQPLVRASIWMTAGTTVILFVYYIFDIFNQFK